MNFDQTIQTLLSSTNYAELNGQISDFNKAYVHKLLEDILTLITSEISLGEIELVNEYYVKNELSQEITGFPSAYSAVDGDEQMLVAFAEAYSKLGIQEYDVLCKEVILDFLNVHNGLFIVDLSNQNICELNLNVPKQSDGYLCTSPATGHIIVIPVHFNFGLIKFLLCELTD